MAKKKKSRVHYTSKGQRPNVSKSIIKDVKRHRLMTVNSLLQRLAHRERIISKPQNKIEANLKEKYIKEDEVLMEAGKLYNKYKVCGVKWSACVQAVKTNWIKEFNGKWYPKYKSFMNSKQKDTVFSVLNG